MGLTKSQEKDFKKFFIEKGDDGFNPKWNEHVIEKTIAKHERDLLLRRNEKKDQIEERADAVSYYLMYLAQHGTQTADKYFGRQEMARLAGENIKSKIKQRTLGISNE